MLRLYGENLSDISKILMNFFSEKLLRKEFSPEDLYKNKDNNDKIFKSYPHQFLSKCLALRVSTQQNPFVVDKFTEIYLLQYFIHA